MRVSGHTWMGRILSRDRRWLRSIPGPTGGSPTSGGLNNTGSKSWGSPHTDEHGGTVADEPSRPRQYPPSLGRIEPAVASGCKDSRGRLALSSAVKTGSSNLTVRGLPDHRLSSQYLFLQEFGCNHLSNQGGRYGGR